MLPELPVRQWVLSLPYRVGLLCAYDPDACALVREMLVRAVAFVQRFDSGLRLNVHVHVLWLDGVYCWEPGRKEEWCGRGGLTDADVGRLVDRVRDRVLRALRRLGKWPDESKELEVGGEEEQQQLALGSAVVQGRAALGGRAGERGRDARPGWYSRDEPYVKAPLCAEVNGFSLRAGGVAPGYDRERLEKLGGYVGRPAGCATS
ncbi:MAG: transposase [bacterium]|nr:transposase [bacterium]